MRLNDPTRRPSERAGRNGTRIYLNRDMDAIYATFHTYEAASAKKLKLGDIWEPTPFAGEVPEAQRKTRCAEPFFTTSPWIARPPGLVQEVPEHPGEIRFADDTVWRKGRVVMLVALTREEAEERHRTRQDYSLATRLPAGQLLVLHHYTGRSPHDPDPRRYSDYLRSGIFICRCMGPWVASRPISVRTVNNAVCSIWQAQTSTLTTARRPNASLPKPGFRNGTPGTILPKDIRSFTIADRSQRLHAATDDSIRSFALPIRRAAFRRVWRVLAAHIHVLGK